MMLTGISCSAFADDIAQGGRQVVDKWHSAIVTIEVVIKMSQTMDGKEGGNNESKTDVTGIVVDPSGLVATSLSATDPADIMRRMMPDSDDKFSVNSQVTGVKIVGGDGIEVPAKIVLRDKDRDLVFIRPLKKLDKPMTAVDLSKGAKPALLDQVVVLHRLGKLARREIAASVGRMGAVIQVPRLYYIPDGALNDDPGAAVFGMDASPVGMVVMKFGSPSGGRMSMSGYSDMFAVIILPTDDILEAAKQAPLQ
jgi:hypothetical protein